MISIGQPWSEAAAIARNAGYELHDASDLAMVPTPDGFYVDMPGERGLIVFRDVQQICVEAIGWVENWSGPKMHRVYHKIDSFELPPASSTER